MSGLVSAKELREKRANLAKQAQELLDRASSEKRELTTEESVSFDKFHGEIESLRGQVERIEKHESVMKELGESRGRQVPGEKPSTGEKAEEVDADVALRNWMLYGDEGLEPAERKAIQKTEFRGNVSDIDGGPRRRAIGPRDVRTISFLSQAERRALAERERRALTVGTTTSGGYTVPQGFSGQLEKALLEYGGMLTVGDVFDTDSGADMPWPTYDDTAQSGAILAENAAASEQDVTFGSVTFKAYKYSSKMIRVPVELMQDSAFSIDAFLADVLGERLGRILNNHFTVGTNSSQPQGWVTAASTGKTGTTGQTLSVIYDDLVDLVYSVDPAYRRQAGTGFMMHDTSVKVIRKLKDSQNRPLWEPSVQVGAPDSILGYPLMVNQDVAVMAASAKSIGFGAFKKYKIRRVRDITLVRLVERYGELHQVAFLAFARFDGRTLDAGTDPIKLYVNSAT